jgi:hypothetical protein
MGVRHCFIYVFCLLSLSCLDKFDSSIRCYTHHTSHTNFNPIRIMPVPSRRSNIYPRRRDAVKKGEIWHETSSFANFGYFTHLHFACQTKQQNFTQQPNPTRQSTLKPVTIKDQRRKKVSNGLLASCWLSIIIISYSPSTSCFKQAYNHTTPKLHPTISHLLNRKLLDEVEEVSNAATHKILQHTQIQSTYLCFDRLMPCYVFKV